MSTSGPSFISLQVSDLDASAAFYTTHLGVTRQPGPPHAVVFATEPIAFALRDPEPGVVPSQLEPWPGAGLALWLQADDPRSIHDAMVESGVVIVTDPFDGPFGLTFVFADPDGYRITVHQRMASA